MIDDNDLDFLVLAFNPRSLLGGIVCAVILIVVYLVVQDNHAECEAKHCPDGQKPALMAHECLCVTEAK